MNRFIIILTLVIALMMLGISIICVNGAENPYLLMPASTDTGNTPLLAYLDATATAWNLTGNAGTVPGAHFLGTLDNVALELKVNNQRAFRLEPNINCPNILGGHAGNQVTSGLFGATIAGGGGTGSSRNQVTANYGSIGGGYYNIAGGTLSMIPGGKYNQTGGYTSFAAGYRAKAMQNGTFVWSDFSSETDFASTLPHSFIIRAKNGVGINTNAPAAALDVDGLIRSRTGGVQFPDGSVQTTAAGMDYWHLTGNAGISADNFLGTLDNTALQFKVNNLRALRLEPHATSPNLIGGYAGNTVTAGFYGAVIAGGGVSGNANTIAAHAAAIGGGLGNVANGTLSVIPGGKLNRTTGYASMAAGYRAKALHNGTYVWSDYSAETDFASSTAFTYLIRAKNGVGINATDPASALDVNGMIRTRAGGIKFPDDSVQTTAAGSATALCWSLTGNSGTTATNFLGTIDNTPLELRANNMTALRVMPADYSPNLIGGSSVNTVAAGSIGCTIGGGGYTGVANSVRDICNTVGGGAGNIAGAPYNGYATVSGGLQNQATATLSTVVGGGVNYATNYCDTVVGGSYNTASGGHSLAAGFRAKAAHGGTFVWADQQEVDFTSTLANTFLIRATNGVGINVADPAAALDVNGMIRTRAGGIKFPDDTVQTTAPLPATTTSWCLNGNTGLTEDNFLGTTDNTAFEIRVNGQRALRITPAEVPNIISGQSSNTVSAGVVGATIAGGGNVTGGLNRNSVADNYGAVGGGRANWVGSVDGVPTNAQYGTIGGGYYNTASAAYATIPGGANNIANGAYSFAAGRKAYADGDGAFVWGDSTDSTIVGIANQFVVRAGGGVKFYTNSALSTGSYLDAGGSGWNNVCDRNAKTNITEIDGRTILRKLSTVPLFTWNYKTQDATVRHLGPMAQDFHAAFALGVNDTSINSIDADGVALAAIQGLYTELKERDIRIAELERKVAEVDDLKARLAALEALIMRQQKVLK